LAHSRNSEKVGRFQGYSYKYISKIKDHLGKTQILDVNSANEANKPAGSEKLLMEMPCF
jgi:hypothetical protein